MAKTTKQPITDTDDGAKIVAPQIADVATKTMTATTDHLVSHICARTGMGMILLKQRIEAFADNSTLTELLEANDMPSIIALLKPSNKA
jgi:hypothetical protein